MPNQTEEAFKLLAVYKGKAIAWNEAVAAANAAFQVFLDSDGGIKSPEADDYESAEIAAAKAKRACARARGKALRACNKVWTS